jgi:hypothetical protein
MKYVSAALALAPLSAFAAVPADVTTALADGKTDTAAIALGVLLIVFGIAVFRWMRSAK